MRVSHETIDKSLFVQAHGVLAKQLQKHLRSRRPVRRTVHNTVTRQWRSRITDAVSVGTPQRGDDLPGRGVAVHARGHPGRARSRPP
jgi:hypothetical protein